MHARFLYESLSQTLSGNYKVRPCLPFALPMLPVTKPCTAQRTSKSPRPQTLDERPITKILTTRNSKWSERSLRLVPSQDTKTRETMILTKTPMPKSSWGRSPSGSFFATGLQEQILWLKEDICWDQTEKGKVSLAESIGRWGEPPDRISTVSLKCYSSPLLNCTDLQTITWDSHATCYLWR